MAYIEVPHSKSALHLGETHNRTAVHYNGDMSNLWTLVWGRPEVDPNLLARAIEDEAASSNLDFRTRVLIRDGTRALGQYWGAKRLDEWLSQSPVRLRLEEITHEDLGETGFPFLKESLMERTDAEVAKEFLRELGVKTKQPVVLTIGGAIALILQGALERSTTDIDVVDEVPESIRNQRDLLDDLQRRYQLLLTHFQSHYLPSGWEQRVRNLGAFGSIQVSVVDVYDVFLGKLFSKRTKDLDDLRALKPQLELDRLVSQLRGSTAALLSDPELRQTAENNWYVVFGESLPT